MSLTSQSIPLHYACEHDGPLGAHLATVLLTRHPLALTPSCLGTHGAGAPRPSRLYGNHHILPSYFGNSCSSQSGPTIPGWGVMNLVLGFPPGRPSPLPGSARWPHLLAEFPRGLCSLLSSRSGSTLLAEGSREPSGRYRDEGGARRLLDGTGEVVSPRGIQARPINHNDDVFTGMGCLLTAYLDRRAFLLLDRKSVV